MCRWLNNIQIKHIHSQDVWLCRESVRDPAENRKSDRNQIVINTDKITNVRVNMLNEEILRAGQRRYWSELWLQEDKREKVGRCIEPVVKVQEKHLF